MVKPTLASVVAIDGRTEDELLALAAGVVDGHDVVVGDAQKFAELGLSVEPLGDWPNRLRQQGQRVVFIAIDGRTAGLVGVVDAAL